MDELPFSLAFVMVKESFAGPTIFFYLASDANKYKRQDHLNTLGMMFRMYCILYAISVHNEHRSGQNKSNVCTSLYPVPSKKQRKDPHIFPIL
jgi:hypothetical protein